MTAVRHTMRSCVLAASLVWGWGSRANAQSDKPSTARPDTICEKAPAPVPRKTRWNWRYVAAPYLWAAGLEGNVGVARVSSSVDLTPADVFRALKFGAMAYGEARHGAWVFGFDGIYVSLGSGKAIAIRGDTGSLNLDQRETILQPMVGYGVGDETWGMDALVGARYWNLSSTLDVDRTLRPSNQRSGSRSWLDGTIGLRFRGMPVPKFHLIVAADGGGGGSSGTWQILGTVGYDFWRNVTLATGYRELSVDYNRNNFLFDTHMRGALFNATVRF